MIASDQLGIPMEKITVLHGDTDLVPRGGGTMGSRSLQQGGAAVHQAAGELVELARERAAEKLEVDPADLVVDLGLAGLTVRGTPGAGISFAELAAEEQLLVRTTFNADAPTFPFGAHVAVVEVDVESGQGRGRADGRGRRRRDDPQPAAGRRPAARRAGAGGGPGAAGGGPLRRRRQPADLDTGRLPVRLRHRTAELRAGRDGHAHADEPAGAKGIGEAGTIGSTPAVQNAVIDAVAHLGVRHIDMPTTPMRVWRAIQQARQEGT